MGTRADRALAEPRARAGVCYLTRLRPALDRPLLAANPQEVRGGQECLRLLVLKGA